MDARLDPAKYAGLAEGDAHVVRNAGGRATDDAIRSLVISHKLLGTREWFVIHHTDCGMLYFDDALMGDLLAGSLDTAELTPQGFRNRAEPGGSTEGRFVKWHAIPDQEESVVEDVTRIRRHPLVEPGDPGLRLRLRRQDRPAERGRPRHRGRPPRRLTAIASSEDPSAPPAGNRAQPLAFSPKCPIYPGLRYHNRLLSPSSASVIRFCSDRRRAAACCGQHSD